jgi:hypothetical protein
VAEEMNPSDEKDVSPEAREVAKKQSRLNALILSVVFLLGVLLPHPYKAFVPFLFIIPLVLAVVNKVRQPGKKAGNPMHNQTHRPPLTNQGNSTEPYSYTPKDPKDPRRYKPIE